MATAGLTQLGSSEAGRETRRREPLSSLILTMALVGILAGVLGARADAIREVIAREWPALVIWGLLVVAVNFLPVTVGPMRLTLDTPLLLAVALIFPPGVAAVLAVASATELREFQLRTSLSRATYNRAQIALSVFLAGAGFRAAGGDLTSWGPGMRGTAVAVTIDFVLNVVLVALHSSLSSRAGLPGIRDRLVTCIRPEYAVLYLGYGFMAAVLALLFLEAGFWSVVIFMVPLLVARQLLWKNQQLGLLNDQLRNQELLVEKSLERLIEERTDERIRVAGELHDEMLQSLVRIQMLSSLLRMKIPRTDTSAEELEELVHETQDAVVATRRVIRGLRSSPIGPGGLNASVRSLAKDLRPRSRADIEVSLPPTVDIPPLKQAVAYQVIREGLVNALKHAQASKISVEMVDDATVVRIVIRDNGLGFERPQVDSPDHFGLRLMERRLAEVGGCLVIESDDGRGTRLTAAIPRQPDGEPLFD